MPELTKPELLDALRAQIATMTGTPAEIAAALNDATVRVVRAVTTNDFLEAVTPAHYAVIKGIAANTQAAGHAEAAWLLQALDAGEVLATAGTRGRAVLTLLITSGLLSAAESNALIAAATVDVREGPSWGEAAGIGVVLPEFVEQVQEVQD